MADSSWDDSDDGMPNMSAGSSKRPRGAEESSRLELCQRVCNALVKDARFESCCPFSQAGLDTLRRTDNALHADFTALFSTRTDDRGCACKGTTKRNLVRTRAHAMDVRTDCHDDRNARGQCHAVLAKHVESMIGYPERIAALERQLQGAVNQHREERRKLHQRHQELLERDQQELQELRRWKRENNEAELVEAVKQVENKRRELEASSAAEQDQRRRELDTMETAMREQKSANEEMEAQMKRREAEGQEELKKLNDKCVDLADKYEDADDLSTDLTVFVEKQKDIIEQKEAEIRKKNAELEEKEAELARLRSEVESLKAQAAKRKR